MEKCFLEIGMGTGFLDLRVGTGFLKFGMGIGFLILGWVWVCLYSLAFLIVLWTCFDNHLSSICLLSATTLKLSTIRFEILNAVLTIFNSKIPGLYLENISGVY